MTKKKQNLEVSKIKFDEEVYPRIQLAWQTVYDYAESIKAGAKFPPITVALFKNQFILIDGYHRLSAYKQLKKKKIEAEIFTGMSKKKIFEEAIRRNISHGRVLSPYEKRRIALKLRQMKYPDSKVSELVRVPMDKLEKFIGQRLVNSLTGETIVKSGNKHFAGKEVSNEVAQEIKESEKKMYIRDQVDLIEQLIDLARRNLLDVENEQVAEKIKELKELV